jgi:hypothetical protein
MYPPFLGECSKEHAAGIEARAHDLLRDRLSRGREWFSVSPKEAVSAVITAARDPGYQIVKTELSCPQLGGRPGSGSGIDTALGADCVCL